MSAELNKARRARLLRVLSAIDPADLTRCLRESQQLNQAVHKAAHVRPPAIDRSPNPWITMRRVDSATLLELAHELTASCLAATREALGDAADEPTLEQLRGVLDDLIERFGPIQVAVLLAAVAVGLGPTADSCDVILDSDERLDVGGDESSPAATTSSPAKEVSADVRAARQARREEKKVARDKKAADDAKAKQVLRERVHARPAVEVEVEVADDEPVATSRVVDTSAVPRASTLTPAEARRFDVDDPLVMSVVIATVRFYGRDPDHPGLNRKERPCVVLGVAKEALLVRPGYSDGGMQSRQWQSHQLRDWAQAGLDGPTWIETKTHIVRRHEASAPLGYVSVDDWNALF